MTANDELIQLLSRMADLLAILDANRFRINAYQRAARAIEQLSEPVCRKIDADALPRQAEDSKAGDLTPLTDLPGVGKGMAEKIVEYCQTGKIAELDQLLNQVPASLLELLDIPNLGPKTVATLWKQAGIRSKADLAGKLDSDELANLPGLGKKSLEKMRQSLAFAEQSNKRMRLGYAQTLATSVVQSLRKLKPVKRCEYAGSLRRGCETVGDIDIIAVIDSDDDAQKVSDAMVKLDLVAKVIGQGTAKTSVRTEDGVQIDLRLVRTAQFASALLYFTGSKQHNVQLRKRAVARNLKLNEYGLFQSDHPVEDSEQAESHTAEQPDASSEPASPGDDDRRIEAQTEADLYRALDLAFVPPPLREDRGEIALAEQDKLPRLVAISDIQAELHCHTHASDGRWSIEQLISECRERSYHTVAITDHSRSQVQADGLSIERLQQHIEQIRQQDRKFKDIHVLAGAEVDILADGSLDYPNSVLKELDVVVASPHAALTQDPRKATERLLKAIRNPYVTILGHPTGRIINRRPGLSPDMAKLIEAAGERRIALEINANHHRLDLRDTHARAAVEKGVKLSINTDAHGPGDLDQLRFGVLTAQRAGATAEDVINTFAKAQLSRFIADTRR